MIFLLWLTFVWLQAIETAGIVGAELRLHYLLRRHQELKGEPRLQNESPRLCITQAERT